MPCFCSNNFGEILNRLVGNLIDNGKRSDHVFTARIVDYLAFVVLFLFYFIIILKSSSKLAISLQQRERHWQSFLRHCTIMFLNFVFVFFFLICPLFSQSCSTARFWRDVGGSCHRSAHARRPPLRTKRHDANRKMRGRNRTKSPKLTYICTVFFICFFFCSVEFYECQSLYP